MAALITIILDFLLKGASIVAKIATNRATFLVVFAGSVFTAITLFSDALSSLTPYITDFIDQYGIHVIGGDLNDDYGYIQTLCYSLSIDTLFDCFYDFAWVFICAGFGFLITVFFGLVACLFPLVTEMFVSALKGQFANVVKSS